MTTQIQNYYPDSAGEPAGGRIRCGRHGIKSMTAEFIADGNRR